jgi:hypothetical protein
MAFAFGVTVVAVVAPYADMSKLSDFLGMAAPAEILVSKSP